MPKRAHTGPMVTRFQRALRLFIAVLALSCGGATVMAEPVAAAPSAYVALLAVPGETTRSEVSLRHSRRAADRVFSVRAALQPSTAGTVGVALVSPTLARSPRLYLRHCALLR